MKLLQIDNIMYKVSDLRKAEEFYTKVLGLKKVWEDMDARMIGFVFEKNDAEIVIHSNDDLPKFDYGYLVESVDNFCDEYMKMGHRVVFGPKEVRPGKYAILQDPDGNELPIIDLSKFNGVARYN